MRTASVDPLGCDGRVGGEHNGQVRNVDVGVERLDVVEHLSFTNQFRADGLIEHCYAVASRGGASILDRSLPRLASVADRPGLAVGNQADLLLVDGETVAAAVMDRGRDRTVIHNGRVVADGGTLTA